MNTDDSFYSDLNMPGMLYARIIRSAKAPGVLEVVSAPELPEGYALFTAEDIPGKNAVTMRNVTTPVFASQLISYVGEPVAMLVGPDIFEVQRLFDAVVVKVIPLKASADAEKMPLLAERTVCAGDNDPESVYENSEIKIDGDYSVSFRPTVCSEYAGCLAVYEGGQLVINTPSSWTTHLRKTVAHVLGIKAGKIWLLKTVSSEQNSNIIFQASLIAAQASLASFLTGKPVKLEYTQAEHDNFVRNMLPMTITHKTALNANGMLDAMLIEIAVTGGAYNLFAGEILDRLVIAATGIYRPKALKIEAKMYKTHTPPSGVYLSWIDYNAFFAAECHVQKIAQTMSLSPVEIRDKNSSETALFRDSFPFQFHLEYCGEVIKTLVKTSDYDRKYVAYTLNAQNRSRGIGLAIAFEGSAFLGSGLGFADQQITVVMEKDGTITISAHQTSPVIRAIWLRVAARELDIMPDHIKIQSNLVYNKDIPAAENAFDNIAVMVQLLKKCCAAIQKQRFRSPLPIKVTRSITSAQRNTWNQEEFKGAPFFSTSEAAAVVELEIDPYTRTDAIRNIWFTLACGEILVVDEAERTIKKATRNILAAFAKRDFNPENIHVSFVETTGEARQIGSLVYRILPAAYMNALSQINQEIAEEKQT